MRRTTKKTYDRTVVGRNRTTTPNTMVRRIVDTLVDVVVAAVVVVVLVHSVPL